MIQSIGFPATGWSDSDSCVTQLEGILEQAARRTGKPGLTEIHMHVKGGALGVVNGGVNVTLASHMCAQTTTLWRLYKFTSGSSCVKALGNYFRANPAACPAADMVFQNGKN